MPVVVTISSDCTTTQHQKVKFAPFLVMAKHTVNGSCEFLSATARSQEARRIRAGSASPMRLCRFRLLELTSRKQGQTHERKAVIGV